MRMDQQQQQDMTLLARVYLFLRDRDAKIIELFFFALNLYIFILVVLPPYSTTSPMGIFWRIMFQLVVVTANLIALIHNAKRIRIFSSIANASIMGLITASLIRLNNPNAGTYALLALLAIFVTWKINIRQQ
jgi:hypothetical protein